jgi:hypothetical protein
MVVYYEKKYFIIEYGIILVADIIKECNIIKILLINCTDIEIHIKYI